MTKSIIQPNSDYIDLDALTFGCDADDLFVPQHRIVIRKDDAGLCLSILQIVGILVVLAAFNWPWLASFQMRLDLQNIASSVRQADWEPETKEHLLDEIDWLREAIRRGHPPSILSWWEFEDSIHGVLSGKLTNDKVRLIEREFDRLARETDETEK